MSLFSDEDIAVRKVYVSGPMASKLVPVAFVANPVFDAGKTNVFQIRLTGDIVSSTLINAFPGQRITFVISQDDFGSHVFVWPTNVVNGMIIGDQPRQTSIQEFIFDGANAFPVAPPTVNDSAFIAI